MTSKFKPDLYLIMLYPSVKFERKCCIPLKVIDRKPQIHNLAKIYVKTGHISVKNLRITLFSELDLHLMMLDPSVKLI